MQAVEDALPPLLQGRTVVVFGGSYGIGADIAKLAAEYGAQVHSFSRSSTGTHVERRQDVADALADGHCHRVGFCGTYPFQGHLYECPDRPRVGCAHRHTGEGSRILNQEEYVRKYGEREFYVARPQAKVDGRELWGAATSISIRCSGRNRGWIGCSRSFPSC